MTAAPAAASPASAWAPTLPPQMRVLRRIGVLSAAKLYGVLLAAFGLILGVFFALFALSMGAAAQGIGAAEAGVFAGMGVFAILLLPLLYGAMGFIAGALGAALYNLCAKWVGGIEVEVA